MDVTLCTSSILHLSCISLDRYYAIVNQPLLYNDRMTKKVGGGWSIIMQTSALRQIPSKVDNFHLPIFLA